MDPKFNNYRVNETGLEPAYQAEGRQPNTNPNVPHNANRIAHDPDFNVDDVEVLKVSAKSRPTSVAGAIAGVIRSSGKVEVQAIGAGATNQAIKAVAIARGFLISSGIDILCIPAFIDVRIEDEERTAIKLLVERRPGTPSAVTTPVMQ